MPADLSDTYRRYYPLLVRKCQRMLGDGHEAEDLAQEAFLRFSRSDVPGDDPRTVTAWLYRTSTRLAIDRLRARRREGLTSLASLAADEAGPDRSLDAQALLTELVRRVPRDEIEAALLSRVDGLTQVEIAEVLGVHERSVRRLLARFEERVARLRARSEV